MKLDLGTIERHGNGSHTEPTDEALIFIDNDNDKTIHIRCPHAKELARLIIKMMVNQ